MNWHPNFPILRGRSVRLEPLRSDHSVGLWQVVTPDVLSYATLLPDAWTFDAFNSYIQRRIDQSGFYDYAMVLQENDQPVGLTAFLDVRPQHRGLEIGATWIAKQYQGTHVNPEAKYLMLRHAFERLDMLRVQLKCDARNTQSQRALAKLGATREGVLRKHVILPDGYVRDTVMYSITDDDWPDVKVGLESRLGYSLAGEATDR